MTDIVYTAVPTIGRFHKSSAFYRGVMGPVGSGKSTGMCMEIMRRAQEQTLGKDGIRRTRWVIVRNTYRELKDTTLKTWFDWFDEDTFGLMNRQDMYHMIRFNDVETEILFRALDRPGDVKKVLSMEISGAWINEAREIPKAIVDAIGDRAGRYPAVKDGGCTWNGVIMDTNPPDDDHWWYRLAETDRPTNWEFFRQPGGLIEKKGVFVENPLAENTKNLEADYYTKRQHGKQPEYIRVYYCGQYGFVIDGKPVIPEYVDAVHCTSSDIDPTPGLTLFVGIDFGLTPAAVFGQRLVNGRWVWIDELATEDMGAVRFSELLRTKINHEYKDYTLEIYGDPAGEARSQTDERTPFQILIANGIPASPAPTNDMTIRRESIAVPLSRMVDGKPGLLISPKCKVTRRGLAGGYQYKRMQLGGQERFNDKPDKNKYSHPVEAGGYMMVGAGEGAMIIKIPRKSKAHTGRKRGPVHGQGWMVG